MKNLSNAITANFDAVVQVLSGLTNVGVTESAFNPLPATHQLKPETRIRQLSTQPEMGVKRLVVLMSARFVESHSLPSKHFRWEDSMKPLFVLWDPVFYIEVFLTHFFHFGTMEYFKKLSANDVIVSQKSFNGDGRPFGLICHIISQSIIVSLALYLGTEHYLKTGPFKICPNFKRFLTKWLLYVRISNGQASRFQISFQIRTIGKQTSFWFGHIRISDPHCIYSCKFYWNYPPPGSPCNPHWSPAVHVSRLWQDAS